MKEEFLKELKALLEKHNASIGFSVSEFSDTYGLYDEKMIVEIGNDIVAEVAGWWITAGDLK